MEIKLPPFRSVEEYVKAKKGRKAINKILIANNGISAVKAIRSMRKWAYEMFENDRIIQFVVMATPEDMEANAEYIRMSDEYVEVPGGTNNNNYANVTRIIEIAESTGADAVWAGWGHASENPLLPERLAKKGILFLGPPPGPMKSLGDKIDSTIIAQSAKVPTLPWNGSHLTIDLEKATDSHGYVHVSNDVYDSAGITSAQEAKEACKKIGYPVMIKASGGGGGKGIRKVEREEQVELAYSQVQSEIPGSHIFIMKLAENSRHLEVQLLADEYGATISLSGRDCSVQRRHQKIIEEGPPLAASPSTWEDMQLAAIRLAKMVGYVNAGTVEYLYMDDGTYSFLELNPRLQVEHPVTEMITGVNLPSSQLQVAMGIPLHCIPDIRRLYGKEPHGTSEISFETEPPVKPNGHVIACRITAENPDAGFQPTAGAIQELNFRSTANVWGYFSVDGSGRVHEYADSQFGHLFSWGNTREDARNGMVQALKDFSVRGEIHTTIEYLLGLIQNDDYVKNMISTKWLDNLLHKKVKTVKLDNVFVAIVAAACTSFNSFNSRKAEFSNYLKRGQQPPPDLLWTRDHEELIYDNVKYIVDTYVSGDNLYTVVSNDSQAQLEVRELADGGFLINVDNRSHVAYLQYAPSGLRLIVDGITCAFSKEYDPTVLTSPNAGKLARYLVKEGDHVKRGEPFAEIEVMKMYMPLLALEDGTITSLVKPAGSIVATADVLGSMSLDDPTMVRRAELFTDKLPSLTPQGKNRSVHPHYKLKASLNTLSNFFRGYRVTQEQCLQAFNSFLDTIQQPTLAYYEFVDLLSTLEGRISDAFMEELSQIVDRIKKSHAAKLGTRDMVSAAASSDPTVPTSPSSISSPSTTTTIATTTTPPTPVTPATPIIATTPTTLELPTSPSTPASSSPTMSNWNSTDDEFPSAEIRMILNKYVLLSPTRGDLRTLLAPLYDLVDKYRNGRVGYAILTFFSLAESYVSNEKLFNNRKPSLVLEEMRKAYGDKACETIWSSFFSHAQNERINNIVVHMLNFLNANISIVSDDNSRFTKLLSEISVLFDRKHILLSLEARQIMLKRKMPTEKEELEIVHEILKNACKKEEPGCRATSLRQLLDQSDDVRHALIVLMGHEYDSEIRLCALECYLRKIYRPYVITKLKPCIVANNIAMSFQFKSDSIELPTGIRPSGSFVGQENILPVFSPRPSSEDYDETRFAYGFVLHVESLNLMGDIVSEVIKYMRIEINDEASNGSNNVPTPLTLTTTTSSSTSSSTTTTTIKDISIHPSQSDNSNEIVFNNALHIVVSEGIDSDRKKPVLNELECIAVERSQQLEEVHVGRVTVTMTQNRRKRFNENSLGLMPASYTCRQRLGYREDPLVRHIEPPLAYHLELHRLRNFNIRLIATPNRSIHLYEAVPKESVTVRGTKLPLRKRFFVRAVCTSLDTFETDKLTDTYPQAEKTLVEALNALEIGLSEASIKGEGKLFGANHIFINILPAADCDHTLIEKIMKNLYLRYVDRLRHLDVSQVEMKLLPILTKGSSPIPIRMIGADPTGMALRIDTYVETKDDSSNSVIFTSINETIHDVGGEWDGHSINVAYPVLAPLERERAYAQSSSNTLYCYDFVELIQRVLLKEWKTYINNSDGQSTMIPNPLMKVREFDLAGRQGQYELKEVSRSPGHNTIGMVAWSIRLFTPTCATKGREIVLICNDITFKAGSFGTKEDALFNLVSKYARQYGLPRIYIAANSGARIGLSQEVEKLFRVKWIDESKPESGFEYLYLTETDYSSIKKSVIASEVILPSTNERVFKIEDIIGSEPDLGVENLSGSGLIAGETSHAYNDIFTLTYVSGRSVGIGAYLVRLGQRTIQKKSDAPIILTGFEALNKLMGRPVYNNNDQLGGTAIMYPNGVTHMVVDHDMQGIEMVLKWLSYVPETSVSSPIPYPLSPRMDVLNRRVGFVPPKIPYDIRKLFAGTSDLSDQPMVNSTAAITSSAASASSALSTTVTQMHSGLSNGYAYGLFDRDSFMELLGGWAQTVVVGRARLGGYPVGVIATESRTIECIQPADPAMPQTQERINQMAGGVWYPDSAYKTSQAIGDINKEGLPLFIIANWRGFSGGARDMFDEILKFGSYIVDNLVAFRQPVFVYIPPHAELRGGAFVVVDSTINSDVMEMYAAPDSRAGVLEPAGAAAIKFRTKEKTDAMHRVDREIIELNKKLSDPSLDEDTRSRLVSQVKTRERLLDTVFQQVAEKFADLHDTPQRMQAVGVIKKVVPLDASRVFFYWRMRRRMAEIAIVRDIQSSVKYSSQDILSLLHQWFISSNQLGFVQENDWNDDECVCRWIERERNDTISNRISTLKRTTVKNQIIQLGKENPYTVTEGILDFINSLSGEVKERVVSSLKRGILLRTHSSEDTSSDDRGNIVEF